MKHKKGLWEGESAPGCVASDCNAPCLHKETGRKYIPKFTTNFYNLFCVLKIFSLFPAKACSEFIIRKKQGLVFWGLSFVVGLGVVVSLFWLV